VTAPRSAEERARMVEEWARNECRSAITAFGDDEPCHKCREKAESAIPPVAPALVTAERYAHIYGFPLAKPGVYGEILATLRHYEAEVGRLEEECRVRALATYNAREDANEGWTSASDFKKIVAREAPFAALGRKVMTSPGVVGKGLIYDAKWPEAIAARAALAAESEPVWSEPAPSGKIYRRDPAKLGLWVRWANATPEEVATVALSIPVSDAAFVARLLEGGKDGSL